MNAFFRWEFNSCETIVKDGVVAPIDYANASPDVSLISLHYYFPWAITALAKWSAFCVATGREMRVALDMDPYWAVGDRDDLSYEEKLAEYRRLADGYFEVEAYRDFCDVALAGFEERASEWFAGPEMDAVLVDTITSTFPAHEHEQMVAHYRGLLEAWAGDRAAAP